MAALGKVLQCTNGQSVAAHPSYPQLHRTTLRLVEQGSALPWHLQKETCVDFLFLFAPLLFILLLPPPPPPGLIDRLIDCVLPLLFLLTFLCFLFHFSQASFLPSFLSFPAHLSMHSFALFFFFIHLIIHSLPSVYTQLFIRFVLFLSLSTFNYSFASCIPSSCDSLPSFSFHSFIHSASVPPSLPSFLFPCTY